MFYLDLFAALLRIAEIESLELDAGITYLDNEPLGRARSIPLYREHYRLLTSRDSPLGDRDQVTWAEVGHIPLCLLTPDMQNRRIVNLNMAEVGAKASPSVESNSTIALIAHVMSGKWSSVVPMKLAEMFTGLGGLVAIPITEPEAEHLVGMITARHDPQTPLLAALIDGAARLGNRLRR